MTAGGRCMCVGRSLCRVALSCCFAFSCCRFRFFVFFLFFLVFCSALVLCSSFFFSVFCGCVPGLLFVQLQLTNCLFAGVAFFCVDSPHLFVFFSSAHLEVRAVMPFGRVTPFAVAALPVMVVLCVAGAVGADVDRPTCVDEA